MNYNTNRWLIINGFSKLVAHFATKDEAYEYMRQHPEEAHRSMWLVHELIDPELINCYL